MQILVDDDVRYMMLRGSVAKGDDNSEAGLKRQYKEYKSVIGYNRVATRAEEALIVKAILA